MAASTTEADDSFDFHDYRENLAEALVEWLSYDADRYEHTSDALTEAVHEVADEEIAYESVEYAMSILQESPNEPTEWNHLAEGKDDWRDVVRAMAFTVVRQDCYDALEAEGYLDDGWNPTPKLESLGEESE